MEPRIQRASSRSAIGAAVRAGLETARIVACRRRRSRIEETSADILRRIRLHARRDQTR
jgi:hypothetical protein